MSSKVLKYEKEKKAKTKVWVKIKMNKPKIDWLSKVEMLVTIK